MFTVDTFQFLSSCRDETHGQVVEGVQQQRGNSRGIAAAGNPVLIQELPYGMQVVPDGGRHDVEGASEGEDRVHILDMRIEGKRTVPGNPVLLRQLLHVDDTTDKVP